MTYFNQAVYPPATALEQNASWQEVNKQLNIELRTNYVASVDYPAKLAALMAGNDLPDMFALMARPRYRAAVAGVPAVPGG